MAIIKVIRGKLMWEYVTVGSFLVLYGSFTEVKYGGYLTSIGMYVSHNRSIIDQVPRTRLGATYDQQFVRNQWIIQPREVIINAPKSSMVFLSSPYVVVSPNSKTGYSPSLIKPFSF